MALRDQPYLPLYVQDFLTDEKLMECSATATGVYIRLMCVMHKSDEYGCILLKQKDKQTSKQTKNFALKLARFMPYSIDEISDGLDELLSEGVLIIEGDKMLQKRMVKDNEISIKRADAGREGGKQTQKLAKAKSEANTESENESKEELLKKRESEFVTEVSKYSTKYPLEMLKAFCRYWTEPNKSRTKMKWELEKTFEIGRRLVTWAGNDKTFNRQQQAPQTVNAPIKSSQNFR